MDANEIKKMTNSSFLLPDPGGEVVRGLLNEIVKLQNAQQKLVDAINQCDGDGGCRAYRVMKEMMG